MLGLVERRWFQWQGWSFHAAPNTALGECPRWTAEGTAVWWVDIPRGLLHRTSTQAGGDTLTYPLGREVAALALDAQGTPWIVVDGLLSQLSADGTVLAEYGPLPGTAHDRCRANDAAWGPDGRLWITTMARNGSSPDGGVVAFHPDHGFDWLFGGLPIGNGPVFDRDRGRAYIADSARRTVFSVPVAAPRNRTHHCTLKPNAGVPDGMAVDHLGQLWVAHHGGGCISIWNRAGARIATIRTPCRCPTAVALYPLPRGQIAVAVTSAPQQGELPGLWLMRYGN